MMQVTITPIIGAKIISPVRHMDTRGWFEETFHVEQFERMGLPTSWPQDNVSLSHSCIIRGLHIQRVNPQGKFVRCLKGVIWDVGLDLRPDSPTFKKWHGVLLRGQETVGVYWPPGIAHGFSVYGSEDAVVYYKCTTKYDKASDGGVNPLDPELKINWGLTNVVASQRDANLPLLADYLKG